MSISKENNVRLKWVINLEINLEKKQCSISLILNTYIDIVVVYSIIPSTSANSHKMIHL